MLRAKKKKKKEKRKRKKKYHESPNNDEKTRLRTPLLFSFPTPLCFLAVGYIVYVSSRLSERLMYDIPPPAARPLPPAEPEAPVKPHPFSSPAFGDSSTACLRMYTARIRESPSHTAPRHRNHAVTTTGSTSGNPSPPEGGGGGPRPKFVPRAHFVPTRLSVARAASPNSTRADAICSPDAAVKRSDTSGGADAAPPAAAGNPAQTNALPRKSPSGSHARQASAGTTDPSTSAYDTSAFRTTPAPAAPSTVNLKAPEPSLPYTCTRALPALPPAGAAASHATTRSPTRYAVPPTAHAAGSGSATTSGSSPAAAGFPA
eukprot:Rhum_TRINITY_DN3173_c0_g1::Rhum_TRINITY_DN3173_c0_g1_i1::g.9849::m.9849